MVSVHRALAERAQNAAAFFQLRADHPSVPASRLLAFVKQGEGRSFDEFICEAFVGHRFSFTGTEYGGDDERWHGEGRAYCIQCGADGDA